MASADVTRALDLARSDDTADFGQGVADPVVRVVEEHLGIRFPTSYRHFLESVGWCSFGGREFYGITPRVLEAKSVPSVVFATDRARQRGLPAQYVVLEDSGSEEQYVLDCSDSSSDGDAPVKAWRPHAEGELETLAEDFGTYLLQAATEATS